MTKKEPYIANNIIISLDFDGVLAYGLNLKLKYAKEWLGMKLSLGQTKKEAFNALVKRLGKNIDYNKDLMDKINEEHIMEYEIPEGCLDVLKALYSQGFRFVIITSRSDDDYKHAKKFVEFNFKGLIEYAHHTKDNSKSDFVKRVMPRIHVDDDLHKLLDLSDLPIELVYYRQPENVGKDLNYSQKEQIYEITKWTQFYDINIELREIHEAICWKENIINSFYNIGLIFAFFKNLNQDQITQLLNEYRTFRKNLSLAA